jgi:hypothetical protein
LKSVFLYLTPLLLAGFVAQAQQNLFNIPAGDLTPQGKFFYQHQSNFYSGPITESKNHLVYGLGKGWEVGMNLQNIKVEWNKRNGERWATNSTDPTNPLKPLVQITAQKFFFFGDKFKTTIGTQIGTHPTQFSGHPHLTHFTYNTWIYEPAHHVKFVVGPYLTDRLTVGAGNQLGVMMGFEAPISKKLLIMGDWVSGNNAAAVGVVGFNFLATKRIQLCLGALLPNPNSSNKPGVVFELNLLGFDDH